MRFLPLLLCSLSFVSTAWAQVPSVPVKPVTGAPPSSQSLQQATTLAVPSDDIGYDPLVKRDPNGKPLTDAKTTDTPSDSQNLRRDTNLRSDRATILPQVTTVTKPRVPAAAPTNAIVPVTPSQLRTTNGYPGNQ